MTVIHFPFGLRLERDETGGPLQQVLVDGAVTRHVGELEQPYDDSATSGGLIAEEREAAAAHLERQEALIPCPKVAAGLLPRLGLTCCVRFKSRAHGMLGYVVEDVCSKQPCGIWNTPSTPPPDSGSAVNLGVRSFAALDGALGQQ